MFKRVFLIVVDSFGIGAMEDAHAFGDDGCDTLGHISEYASSLKIDIMVKLGLNKLHPIKQYPNDIKHEGVCAVLKGVGAGKDTLSGHWEMMGLHCSTPFLTFTDTGFPQDLITELEKRCNHKVIGNKAASGTVILDELAEEQIRDNSMIVYTSADSVLQICGHEKYFGLEELYRCCEIAREITMKDEWRVGRVIARPYLGEKKGEFVRTPNRKDYALKPFAKTDLNTLKENGKDVIAIGKIEDIFSGEGISEAYHSKSSVHGMEQTIEIAKRDFDGLCFVNLVDFDAKWGHRRDIEGYAKELENFDVKLNELLSILREDDLVIISADHGNDPSFKGTDHTREKVPFIAYSPLLKQGKVLEEQEGFGCIGATILDNFSLKREKHRVGDSLLPYFDIKNNCNKKR